MTKLRKTEIKLGLIFSVASLWAIFVATTHQAMILGFVMVILYLHLILVESIR